MSDRIPGELVALVQTPDTDGTSRMAVIIATPRGAEVGVLVAPRNGNAGQLGFEPVPRLKEGMLGSAELEAAEVLARQAGAAAGVDPNDPRGLRGGPRRAGMIG